jgi:hypothetical protein
MQAGAQGRQAQEVEDGQVERHGADPEAAVAGTDMEGVADPLDEVDDGAVGDGDRLRRAAAAGGGDAVGRIVRRPGRLRAFLEDFRLFQGVEVEKQRIEPQAFEGGGEGRRGHHEGDFLELGDPREAGSRLSGLDGNERGPGLEHGEESDHGDGLPFETHENVAARPHTHGPQLVGQLVGEPVEPAERQLAGLGAGDDALRLDRGPGLDHRLDAELPGAHGRPSCREPAGGSRRGPLSRVHESSQASSVAARPSRSRR